MGWKTKIYWIATSLLALGMIAGGTAQILKAQFNIDGMNHIGFPIYIMPLLGIWKYLGVIVLLVPNYLLAKEWAYAGFFFLLTGASVSHLASGDKLFGGASAPIIFTILTVVSWYFRPHNRRIL